MVENRFSFRTSWLTVSLLIALSIVNLLLIKQNFDLRKQLTEREETGDTTDSLTSGEVVVPIIATDINGQTHELKYTRNGRQHLLLFLSPSCAYCVQQAPFWRDVLNKIDDKRFNVVGIASHKEDRQMVFAHAEESGYFRTKTPLPILFFSDESLSRYKLLATPTTLLISDDGSVRHAWVGMLNKNKENEVTAALQ